MNRSEKEGVSDELIEWRDAISTYEREFAKWEKRVDKILKRYRDEERKDNGQSRFNILWSNVQTLVPATFSRLPIPDVTRRFKDNDPVGRVAAQILERALDFEIQHYVDYRATMDQGVHDRFLGGRATAWVRYEPHFKAIEGQPQDGVQITEDTDEPEIQEQLDYECTPVDYVHWKDFGHNVARTWEEVTQVWRNVYMSKAAVEKRFGKDMAKRISYDQTPEELKRASREGTVIQPQAKIVELWDKEKGVAVWIAKGIKEPLDQVDDPLGLQDFFPCPKPLYATMTNESLIPVPDYTLYQDQAGALDVLSDRIAGLVEMLQLKGVYDDSNPVLARLFTEGTNGQLLPGKNWAQFAEKSGLAGSIDLVDLTQLSSALQTAIEAFIQLKDQIDELTGLADIVRGQSDPNETLGAQKIKGNYANLRLTNTQKRVAEFATSILRLKAQVMCLKFDPKTIAAMAAVEQLSDADKALVQPALTLLVGEQRMMDPAAEAPNPMRSFRIEIAADTLVELDEQQEKQDRMEFLTANGDFMEKSMQTMAMAGPAAPILLPVIMELWKFGITGFKVGKSVEGTLDMAAEKLKEMAQQPQPQAADPKAMEEQAMQQAKQQVMIENAQKETALNKRAADLDVKQIKLDAQERELALKEELGHKARQMEDEHKAKLADVERQAQEQERTHNEAMDAQTQREREFDVKETANKAAGDLESKAAVAEERLKTHDVVAKEVEGNRGEIKEALKAVTEEMKNTQKAITQLAELAGKDRISRLVKGADGKTSHAISEVAK